MILFLDFDGVLHPEGLGEANKDRLFCCLPLLHQILRAAPGVDVVFSTSWRQLFPREALVQMVTAGAPDLASRFIGQTPDLPTKNRPEGLLGHREDEILAWLILNGHEARPWLALDDYMIDFRPGCSGLYLVDANTGLVAEDVWTVVECLRC